MATSLKSLTNASEYIEAFPASRRTASNYSSRIYTEDNIIRDLQLCYYNQDKGNLIIDYSPQSYIEFCIHGYYFKIFYSNDDNNLVNIVDNALVSYTTVESIYVAFERADITTGAAKITSIKEFDCSDSIEAETMKFNGLYYTKGNDLSEGDGTFMIELLVPVSSVDSSKSGKLVFNPKYCINEGLNKDRFSESIIVSPNRAYFVSDVNFAISKYSDKAKIWIDNEYYIPHICINESATTFYDMWMPLGAVYKGL